MLHFGFAPRFNKNVKIIQIENDPHEIGVNIKTTVPLVGDGKIVLAQMNQALGATKLVDDNSQWWKDIRVKQQKNQQVSMKLYNDLSVPMNYYSCLKTIEDGIHRNIPNSEDYIMVQEGSNIMDIGRTMLMNSWAGQRLDAGTFGTMGVGFANAIAA